MQQGTFQQGTLFLIAAPSGAGKTTLVTKVIERVAPSIALERMITYTSRPPRAADIPGKDYHFLTNTEFETKIAENFFLEWSNAYGAYYGTPWHEFDKLKQGVSLIVVVDRQGMRSIKNAYTNAITIGIMPPDYRTLASRLIRRDPEKDVEIAFRLQLAQRELEEENREKLFSYIVLNDDVERALNYFEWVIRDTISGATPIHNQKIQKIC